MTMDKKLDNKYCPDCGQSETILKTHDNTFSCPKCWASWRMT